MGLINNRASVLAIRKETSDGSFLFPSAAGQYIAKQPDFAISPNIEELENEEIKNSLGRSKSILGIEAPQGSGSHYWRASGAEGTAPGFAAILESAFGSQVIVGTERATVAGSTTTVLKFDTGHGASFERGQPLLIKDSVNGFSVRNVLSVSGDDVTLNFALDNAPGSGVSCGKPVFWKPANDDHPSLSVSHWLGNGGGIEALAGGRTTNLSVNSASGELVNMDFTIDGTWYAFNPIEITSSNKFVDFNDGAVQVAQLVERIYKDPHDLAEALQTAMDAESTDNITVVYNDKGADAGKYTIATDGITLSLLWNTGTNAANSVGETIGFAVAADDTGETSYTSDNEIDLTAPQTPEFDAISDPVVAKDGVVLLGDSDDNVCFKADSITMSMDTPKTDVGSICAESGIDSSRINSREVTIEISAALRQYDADLFRRFRRNEDTSFMVGLGPKSGGNWIPGRVINAYAPTCTVIEPSVEDNDGVVFINFTLRAFVDANGSGEFYMGQL